MHNDLIRYASGDVTPRRPDREVAQRAKGVYDETRLAGLKVDAAMALGAHVMEGTAQLDAHRRALAGNNEQLNSVLCNIEIDTIRQAQTIQRQTFNRFGL
jgi:hypothetical protein